MYLFRIIRVTEGDHFIGDAQNNPEIIHGTHFVGSFTTQEILDEISAQHLLVSSTDLASDLESLEFMGTLNRVDQNLAICTFLRIE